MSNPPPVHARPDRQQNQNLSLSADGRNALIRHEGVIRHYYNDAVNNCTYGIGTLAHLGPCTAEELRTQVTDAQAAIHTCNCIWT